MANLHIVKNQSHFFSLFLSSCSFMIEIVSSYCIETKKPIASMFAADLWLHLKFGCNPVDTASYVYLFIWYSKEKSTSTIIID